MGAKQDLFRTIFASFRFISVRNFSRLFASFRINIFVFLHSPPRGGREGERERSERGRGEERERRKERERQRMIESRTSRDRQRKREKERKTVKKTERY